MPDAFQESAAKAARPVSSNRRAVLLFVAAVIGSTALAVLVDFAYGSGIVARIANGIAVDPPPYPQPPGIYTLQEPDSISSISPRVAGVLVSAPQLVVLVALMNAVAVAAVVLAYSFWGKPPYQLDLSGAAVRALIPHVLARTAMVSMLWFPLAYAARFFWWKAYTGSTSHLYATNASLAAPWVGAMLLTLLTASAPWRAAVSGSVPPHLRRCALCHYVVGTTGGRCPECGAVESASTRFSLARTRLGRWVGALTLIVLAASFYCAPLTIALGLRAYWTVWLALKGGSMVP